MTIDVSALPRPSRVEVEPRTNLQQSRWREGTPLVTRDPDPANARALWSLSYEKVHAVVGSALREHYQAHHDVDWDWTPPGSLQARRVIYAEPTSIDWQNPTTCDARVFLEEVLAHD